MKKTISGLLLLSLLIVSLLCLCSREDNGGKTQSATRSRIVSYVHFNTVSIIYSYGDVTDAEFDRYAELANETLEYYHKLFDIYYAYTGINNLNTVNAKAGKSPVKVDRALIDFLLYCKELYTLTDGKTNVMLGSVLKLWHTAREMALDGNGTLDPTALPSEAELKEASEHASIDLLEIDEEASTVYISDPLASLDVGAIAKGYAVEILHDLLVEEGADALALNVGGNLRTVGLMPGGKSWTTGVSNPDKSSAETVKCRIEIGASSVVTTGDYERYFYAGDRKYHHVIDPAPLMPAEYFASVTIVSADSGLADALSTALFCMSYEDGLAFSETLEGVEVIWVFRDGELRHTDGITPIS